MGCEHLLPALLTWVFVQPGVTGTHNANMIKETFLWVTAENENFLSQNIMLKKGRHANQWKIVLRELK